MSKSNLPKHFRPKKGLMVIAGLVTSCLGGFVSPVHADNMVCYAIADNDRHGNKDQLVKFDASTGELVGDPMPTNTTSVEASAFDCEGGQLYVVDGGILGTLDVDDTGVFTPIGTGLGTGIGIKGAISINDIDGLAFDCSTGKLYGTHRIEEQGPLPTNNDLLVEINPVTGKIVKNAFGTNKDYVPITNSRPDIDDIAWDPGSESIDDNDKEMYAIANEGMGKNSHLGNLQKADASESVIGGMLTGLVVNERVTKTVDDIESLTFASEPNADGTFNLYGTTGDSIGAGNPSTGHRLYKINKLTGGTTPIGPSQAFSKGKNPQYDFEAVACRSEIPNCVLYAVHDEDQIDSQIIRIDPFKADQTISLQLMGGLHEGADIEGLVIVPADGKPGNTAQGRLFGFSGGDGEAVPQGAVYEISREDNPPAGQITLLGLTGFMEVSAAGLQYLDNDSDGAMDAVQPWGWARKNHKPSQPNFTLGPIMVNPDSPDPKGVKQGPAIKVAPAGVPFPDIESIAMSNDGKTLYGIQYVNKKVENPAYPNGTHLWAYDIATKKLTPQCFEGGNVHPFVHAEVEGLEMQPNGLLLYAIYHQGKWGFGALNPATCVTESTRVFNSTDYLYDLESIEFPADECRGRSWLYTGSGDAEVTPLPEYDDIPDNVGEAIEEGIGEEGGVESGDGLVQVFVGDQHYVFLPTIFDAEGANRAGTRSEEDGSTDEEECLISNVDLSLDEGRLAFTDCNGSYKVRLDSAPVSREALLNALSVIGQPSIDNGDVTITLADGSTITARLSAEVQTTGELNLGAVISAELSATDDEKVFVVNYSSGHSQKLFLK